MIELLKSLVGIPSLSRSEGPAADALQQWMLSAGLDVHRKGNNLWSEQPGRGDGRPVVLLNAHIDTVRPVDSWTRDPFVSTLEGDRLYGLGTNDDGGSLIALLQTFMLLKDTTQSYRLIYSVSAEEEVCGVGGFDALLPELGPIALGVIGEPTGMQMAVAEKGLMVLDCSVHGVSGHAAREEGINAIYKAMEAVEWFRAHEFERVSDFLGPVKMTVTQIEAGTQHNVVPDLCSFVVDCRPNGMYSNAELLELISREAPCKVRARSTRLNSSMIPMSHPIVQRGLSLGLSAFGSPTCSNQTLSPFTTIKIGPGESSRSHSADEYICVSEIEDGVNTYVKLLDGLTI